MQTELPIESQEDAERALVEKLRQVYYRYGSLSLFFQKLSEGEEDSPAELSSSQQSDKRLVVARCGKA